MAKARGTSRREPWGDAGGESFRRSPPGLSSVIGFVHMRVRLRWIDLATWTQSYRGAFPPLNDGLLQSRTSGQVKTRNSWTAVMQSLLKQFHYSTRCVIPAHTSGWDKETQHGVCALVYEAILSCNCKAWVEAAIVQCSAMDGNPLSVWKPNHTILSAAQPRGSAQFLESTMFLLYELSVFKNQDKLLVDRNCVSFFRVPLLCHTTFTGLPCWLSLPH